MQDRTHDWTKKAEATVDAESDQLRRQFPLELDVHITLLGRIGLSIFRDMEPIYEGGLEDGRIRNAIDARWLGRFRRARLGPDSQGGFKFNSSSLLGRHPRIVY
jgi:hypothetical protein